MRVLEKTQTMIVVSTAFVHADESGWVEVSEPGPGAVVGELTNRGLEVIKSELLSATTIGQKDTSTVRLVRVYKVMVAEGGRR